jgi:hypothetical protein
MHREGAYNSRNIATKSTANARVWYFPQVDQNLQNNNASLILL